jgi:hypothetical protein
VTRIPVPVALALRRVVLVACALAATLVAHALAVGGIDVAPIAPFAWLMLLLMVTMAGPRRAWRPRHPLATLGIAAALQALMHLAMAGAPWAFGIGAHHAAHATAGPGQIVPHAVAALLTALVVWRLERWLSRAAQVMARLRRWFARAAAAVASIRPFSSPDPRPPCPRRAGARFSRGPPVLRGA